MVDKQQIACSTGRDTELTMVFFPSPPTLHLFLVMSVCLALDVDDDKCPPEYIQLPHYDNRCFYIGTPTTWTDAWTKCHSDLGVLYSFNDLHTGRPWDAISAYLNTNGINRTWTGIYIRDGLRMDTLEDPYFVETSIHWAEGQPDEGQPGDRLLCSSTPFPGTPKRENIFPQESDYTPISLTDCDAVRLPYVCATEQLLKPNLQRVSTCPSGYFGSPRLQQCYKESGVATFEDAENLCTQGGGKLARVDLLFHLNVVSQGLTQLRTFEETENPISGPTWVDAGTSCNVIDSRLTDMSYHWNCNATLNYVCEKPALYEEKIDITATAITRFPARPIGKSGDVEISLPKPSESGQFARLNCSFKGFNSAIDKVAWYRNGRVMPIWMYSTNRDGVYLNVTLGVREAPITMVGYYWCETNNRNKKRLERSNSIFLRLIDEELHAGSIELEQPQKILTSTYSRFNLFGTVTVAIDTIVKAYNSTTKGILPTFIHPLRFRNRGAIMDFMSYHSSIMTDDFIDPKDVLKMTKEYLQTGFRINNAMKYFQPNTLQLRSIDYCFDFKHVVEETGREFLIPRIKLGQTFYSPQRCLVNNRPFGVMECKGDKLYGAYWGEFQLNAPCDVPDLPDSAISPSLKTVSEVAVNDGNVEEVLRNASTIIQNATLTVIDLLYVTNIMENSVQVSDITTNAAKNFLEVYEKVLETTDKVLVDSQTIGKVANRVLKATDLATAKLKIQQAGHQKVVSDTFGTEAWDITRVPELYLRIGQQLVDNATTLKDDSLEPMFASSELNPNTYASIFFKKEFLRSFQASEGVRVSVNVYQNTRLFGVSESSSGDERQYQLNSKIIAAKILVDGRPITDLTDSQVTAVFLPNKILPTDKRSNLTTCGYWNFTGNDDRGSWSTDGCRYVREEYGRDVCVCEHLTNFAVLLDFYGQDTLTHSLALSIITIIGLSLSILGLSLTVLTFIIFRKLRRNRVQQTLFNLALAELFSWIVFLAGINQTQDYIGCIAVAVLLHYLILVSFMWMLMEAVLHYFQFVKVLGTYISKYMLKTALPAWGIPLLPPVIILAIDPSLYRGGENYCWMSLTPFYYGFSLPVGLIIISNIVLYIMVVVNICRKSSAAVRSTQADRDRMIVNVRASCLCFVLLGLSWVFGYMAIADARVVFQYIFTITNSIQGFLIFILFIARNKEVRDSWRKMCCKKKVTKDSKSNLYSVAGTANTKQSTLNTDSSTDGQCDTAVN
ncbi:uncharacterized protein LOC124132157 isoform X2 [Haliotis rufescens]|uniref:uncharacterized protein LOC124132157 isoform X2 n=1 Tax=Haliotis rufescens TaxID=6454 RepID=UPI00201F06E2|nr:uncharacterized protein LOC124132157 isoform X2 [Haliotis rufescens]